MQKEKLITNIDISDFPVLPCSVQKDSPLKWLKTYLLSYWKLRPIEVLQQQQFRFKIENWKECLRLISLFFKSETGTSLAIIVKLIYADRFLKLPNYIIKSEQECFQLSNILSETNLQHFSEIWFCTVYNSANCLYGRILINISNLSFIHPHLHYEMVWGNTARLLETYPAITEPYISFQQEKWYREGRNHLVFLNLKKCTDYCRSVEITLKEIYLYKKEIIDFCQFLGNIGCSHLSLEFKTENGVFNFIDWDSDQDKKVIKKFQRYMRGR